ncbi:MAG: hypothetical protein KA419_00335 [Acidobacteria bacterium]|nr:hypothetical protein [Acidobacteriota bacterium]
MESTERHARPEPCDPSSGKARRGGLRSPGIRAGALIVLFFLAVFWKLFLTGDYSMLVAQDDTCQSYPWLQYIAKSIRSGDFPLWDPTANGGQSFTGELQTGAFYPPNWLLALAPAGPDGRVSDKAIEGLAFLHVLFAAFCMARFARRLGLGDFAAAVAGIVFAASGSVLFRSPGQLNIFFSAAWVPFVFLFFQKALRAPRRTGTLFFANVAGLGLALSFLAGHFQPPFFTALALVGAAACSLLTASRPGGTHLFSAASRTAVLLALGGTFLFAALYAAPQLTASLEYSRRALRFAEPAALPAAEGMPYEVAGNAFPLSPASLPSAVLPQVLGPENVLYFGVTALLLGVLGLAAWRSSRDARVCTLFAVIFLLLAMGSWSPLHGLAWALVPGFDRGREAARLLLMFHFFAALLCGIGASRVFSRGPAESTRPLKRTGLAAAFLGVFVALTALVGHLYGVPRFAAVADCNLYFYLGLVLVAGGALLLLRAAGLLGERALKAFLLLVLLHEIAWVFSFSIHPKAAFDGKVNREPVRYYAPDAAWAFLAAQPGPFRVEIRDDRYPYNLGKVNGIETVNGHGATVPAEVGAWRVKDPSLRPGVFQRLGVRFVVSATDPGLPLTFEGGGTRVYRYSDAMPRAWVVGEVSARPPGASVSPFRPDLALDPRTVVTVNDTGRLPDPWQRRPGSRWAVPAKPVARALRYQRPGPNGVRVDLDVSGPGLLVLGENVYPGWTAEVNGAERPLLRVDGFLFGVAIDGGRSRVVFRYWPTHLTLSLALFAVAALSLGILALPRFGKQSEPRP